MHRFTRLTNAFSKKIVNTWYAIALHFVYYNFCRIHKTLRVTPAKDVKLSTMPKTIEDIVNFIYAHEIEAENKRKERIENKNGLRLQPFFIIFNLRMLKMAVKYKKKVYKIHPLLILGAYVLLHIVVTMIYASLLHGGEADFEFIVLSIDYFPFSIFAATIILCFIFPSWSKKYWWIIGLLLLFGIYPTTSYLMDKYIYHNVQGVFFTPFGNFD